MAHIQTNQGSLTTRQRDTFLRQLEKGATVAAAARKAGRKTQRFYDLRKVDGVFAQRWEVAQDGRVYCGGSRSHRTETERQAARRESWRRYKKNRRAQASRFPSEANYTWWRQVKDPYMRWWLERVPLADIVAMGSQI